MYTTMQYMYKLPCTESEQHRSAHVLATHSGLCFWPVAIIRMGRLMQIPESILDEDGMRLVRVLLADTTLWSRVGHKLSKGGGGEWRPQLVHLRAIVYLQFYL